MRSIIAFLLVLAVTISAQDSCANVTSLVIEYADPPYVYGTIQRNITISGCFLPNPTDTKVTLCDHSCNVLSVARDNIVCASELDDESNVYGDIVVYQTDLEDQQHKVTKELVFTYANPKIDESEPTFAPVNLFPDVRVSFSGYFVPDDVRVFLNEVEAQLHENYTDDYVVVTPGTANETGIGSIRVDAPTGTYDEEGNPIYVTIMEAFERWTYTEAVSSNTTLLMGITPDFMQATYADHRTVNVQGNNLQAVSGAKANGVNCNKWTPSPDGQTATCVLDPCTNADCLGNGVFSLVAQDTPMDSMEFSFRKDMSIEPTVSPFNEFPVNLKDLEIELTINNFIGDKDLGIFVGDMEVPDYQVHAAGRIVARLPWCIEIDDTAGCKPPLVADVTVQDDFGHVLALAPKLISYVDAITAPIVSSVSVNPIESGDFNSITIQGRWFKSMKTSEVLLAPLANLSDAQPVNLHIVSESELVFVPTPCALPNQCLGPYELSLDSDLGKNHTISLRYVPFNKPAADITLSFSTAFESKDALTTSVLNALENVLGVLRARLTLVSASNDLKSCVVRLASRFRNLGPSPQESLDEITRTAGTSDSPIRQQLNTLSSASAPQVVYRCNDGSFSVGCGPSKGGKTVYYILGAVVAIVVLVVSVWCFMRRKERRMKDTSIQGLLDGETY